MNKATVKLEFASPSEAEIAAAAIAPDNGDHLESSVTGSTLVITADATSVMGLLRTLDDALGCLRATGMD